MLRVLAGDLTATFNVDGNHLKRYINRKAIVIRSLCDQLVLHDQLVIPTHDYLTAAGLIKFLGEHNVIYLLEHDRLRFIRLQGVFGFARGTGTDGSLITFTDPDNKRPQDAPIENSVEAALTHVNSNKSDKTLLARLLVQQSENVETAMVVDAIRKDAYADLEQTTLWNESYRNPKPSLLDLPGQDKMAVRVLGPGTNVVENVVDALLVLGLMNVELYLSEQFRCTSTSTRFPFADCVALKIPRLDPDHPARPHLWSFMKIAGVPDPSRIITTDKGLMTEFLKHTSSSKAKQFRDWFHTNGDQSEDEILAAYLDALHDVPKIEKAPMKILRFAVSTVAGLVPGVGGLLAGGAASLVDTFVVDKILAGKSPKFFIDELRKFSGRIKSRE